MATAAPAPGTSAFIPSARKSAKILPPVFKIQGKRPQHPAPGIRFPRPERRRHVVPLRPPLDGGIRSQRRSKSILEGCHLLCPEFVDLDILKEHRWNVRQQGAPPGGESFPIVTDFGATQKPTGSPQDASATKEKPPGSPFPGGLLKVILPSPTPMGFDRQLLLHPYMEATVSAFKGYRPSTLRYVQSFRIFFLKSSAYSP